MKLANGWIERDRRYLKIIEERGERLRIACFGAGIKGMELFQTLKSTSLFSFFIDNDERKQRDGCLGKEVLSFSDFEKLEEKPLIVISAVKENKLNIERQLQEEGLKHFNDFIHLDEFLNQFLPIYFWRIENKVFMPLSQIVLTERCTLKCKNCAHGCYRVSADNEDMSLEDVYKSADAFFKRVDYIDEFQLIGGEPLLYKKLEEAVRYVGERYRNRINILGITTNGSILPKQNVLDALRAHGVLVRISNYGKAVPRLRKSYEKLTELLERNGIQYRLTAEEWEWMDYGFEYVNRGTDERLLEAVFNSCQTPCREVRGNQLHFCVMARSISENLAYHVGEKDYLDLDELGEDYRKAMLDFNLGYTEKGYLDMCAHCHGADCIHYPIPAAEQLR